MKVNNKYAGSTLLSFGMFLFGTITASCIYENAMILAIVLIVLSLASLIMSAITIMRVFDNE